MGTFFSLRSEFDRVIAVSQFLKKELVVWYRLNPEQIEVVYNGVDLQRFHPKIDSTKVREEYATKDNPLVTFVGRLAPYKGPQFLFEAIPNVLREVPETKFMFVGSSRFETAKIGDITILPEVKKAVIFTGYVNDEFLPNLYAACDVFCYPSLWEGFGLTPAEAQASGKPVVAFNTCAIPEVVQNGVTGMLVSPKDSRGLARAIVRLLRDPTLRMEMGQKARSRAERLFSWEKSARQTQNVYEKALEVHRSHR